MDAAVIWAFAYSFILHSFVLVSADPKKPYMVQVKHQPRPAPYKTHGEWFSDLFQSLTSAPKDSLLYTYEFAYHGFAASLTPNQAESLRQSDLVLGVHEDTLYTLQTTRSPEFLNLDNPNFWPRHSLDQLEKASHDVVIGLLDTGVWPESQSFLDGDMPDIPATWQGKCESGEPKTRFCNKKLIGARFFYKGHSANLNDANRNESRSVRDIVGHGTHTASTAGGSLVENADSLGYAKGVARGMAPGVRLAAYKACWATGCYESDITAAIDSAISDGVDVLSISLGGSYDPGYAYDSIAIGAFAAMERGIVVSCSAGNNGPYTSSLTNTAPWLITVGAGTIDRDFPAYVSLGNGMKYTGASLYSGPGMGSNPLELVYGGGSKDDSELCLAGSLDPSVVRGKVVLCDRGTNARAAKCVEVSAAGGVGMILANTEQNGGEGLVADSHMCPAVAVVNSVGNLIRKYVNMTKQPTALLSFGGTVVTVRPSPVVASFSSRGPNGLVEKILKPDIIGPGVNILAGWSGAMGPSCLEVDPRRVKFNIISGTSMSCPHISGLAALIKAAHPKWSPSAIKSALMTTAYTLDNTNSPLRDEADNSTSTPWAHGAGYVDPQKAISPGLVYDATTEDYIAFLCSIRYTIDMIEFVLRRSNVTCAGKFNDPAQLNYPSFVVVFGRSRVVNYTRELTNVDDDAESIYRVSVQAPPNVTIDVQPRTLVFRKSGEKQRYTATFTAQSGSDISHSKYPFGFINWVSAKNQVKCPVAFISWWF